MDNNRQGCLKTVLIVLATLFIIGAILGSCTKNSGNTKPASSYTSSARVSTKPSSTPKPSMPSTMQFGDDAEQIAADMKKSLGDSYKFSWFANGYKFSFTARTLAISGDDLSALYASDPAGTQSMIDKLNASMQEANKSTWDRFKNLGYSDCTVVFSLKASDDMEICTVENGEITHSITAENFRYG